MPTYTNFNKLITDLIKQSSAENAPNIDNFSSLFYNDLVDALPSDFWAKLLNYLNQEGTSEIGTTPIRESTFNEDSTGLVSVFNYINKKADLSDDSNMGVWARIANSIKSHIDLNTDSGVETGYTGYFWNESMNYIIALFLKTIDPNNAQIFLGQHGSNDVYVSVGDIKNADAGWSFLEKWVKPLKNIDELEYEKVRAQDAIKSVLKNSTEMQFTHTQSKNNGQDLNKWIRLIMPKYLRKVEVEDLNRNFWVIAQVISAISAYLFGENSLAEILRRMLNELIQLWENVLYLWATFAVVSQKPLITNIHVEFVPIPNSELQSYIKFDNFGATATVDWGVLEKRLNYLFDCYSDCNLVIIPQVREGNYKHNYYYRESYPGAIVYNRNLDKKYYIDFKLLGDTSIDGAVTYPVIDLKHELSLQTFTYADRIGAITEDEVYYQYTAPFSDTLATATLESSPYYGILRTVPSIVATYDEENNAIKIARFSLEVYDVAQEIIKQSEAYILDFSQQYEWTSNLREANSHSDLYIEYLIVPENPLESETLQNQPILQGYYMGELVSYQSVMALDTYTIESQPYFGQQMMFATPTDVKELLEEG